MLFAAHWVGEEQVVLQLVLPLHAYAPHPVVLTVGQLPAPSQTAGLVIVPLLHDIARQVVSAPGILHVALVPSQLPAQLPLPLHAV